MLSINNIFEVHSIKRLIKKQKLEKTIACVNDGESLFKQRGYRFGNLFFVVSTFVVKVYVYDDDSHWIVR